MNKEFEKDKKFNQLNKAMEIVARRFGDESVFIVYFLQDNTTIEAAVIPPFDNVCLCEPLVTTILNGIVIKDIRYAYDATHRGHPEMIDALYTDYYIVSPRYEHLFDNLLYKYRDEIRAGMVNKQPSEKLRIALVKILRTAWNDTSAAVRFCKQLTDAEKVGLEGIVAAIGDEGIFSQAKVASATGISRITMTNLVQKIYNCGVGEVEFHGTKGTYIHFYDDTVMNIRGTNNL